MSSAEHDVLPPETAEAWRGAHTRYSFGIPGDEPILLDPERHRVDFDVVTFKATDWEKMPESRTRDWLAFEFETLGERFVRAALMVFSAARVGRRPDEPGGRGDAAEHDV